MSDSHEHEDTDDKPDKPDKPEKRDYTPFSVNMREAFTLITGIQPRGMHKTIHHLYEELTGSHFSCESLPKIWFMTHRQIATQLPELAAYFREELKVEEGADFGLQIGVNLEKSDFDPIKFCEAAQARFGDKFMVTPVDPPKGPEMGSLIMDMLGELLGNKLKEVFIDGDVEVKVVPVTSDVAEMIDEMINSRKFQRQKKKEKWPN